MSFAVAAPRTGRNLAFTLSMTASIVLHGAIIGGFLQLRPPSRPPMPPIYEVELIAAAPGPPAAGLVAPTAPVVEPEKPLPARPKSDEVAPVQTKAPPRRAPRLATPNVSDKRIDRAAPAPVAAGGDEGGKGTDVANIRIEGIDFPYPGYLDNIVRQIALRFQWRGAPLKAEVSFLIRRDGSVMGLRFVQRSGSFTFDLEAQGAVEGAATAGRFGQLPAGWKDDVLPVMFTFDPTLIRR